MRSTISPWIKRKLRSGSLFKTVANKNKNKDQKHPKQWSRFAATDALTVNFPSPIKYLQFPTPIAKF